MTTRTKTERILVVGDASSVRRASIPLGEHIDVEIVSSLVEAAERHANFGYDRVIVDPSVLGGTSLEILTQEPPETASATTCPPNDGFSILARNMPGSVSRFDRNLRYLYANPAAGELTGVPYEELSGMTNADLGLPEDMVVQWEAAVRRVFASGQLEPIEVCAPGERGRWYRGCIVPEFGPDGSVETVLSIVQDVTEQKVAEEALRENEERFRAMADGIPVMIWVTDPQGRMQFVNRAYTEFFGVSLDDVQSGGWQPLVHPDDSSEYAAKYTECLRERKSFQAQVRVRRADGQWRWVESHGEPRFSASGAFLGIAGSSPDITERKATEKALCRQRELLQRTIESTNTQIAYLDREMRFVMANTAYVEACGHSWEKLAGRSHFEIFPSEENEAIFIRARDTGEAVEFKGKPFEFADQPWRGVTYWDWALVPAKDADGKVVGLVFSLTDVTHIKRTEEAMLRTNERLRILSDIAGELLLSDSPQKIVQSLCERVMVHLGCHAFFNFLVVEEKGCLHMNACAGIPEDTAKSIEWLDFGVAVCGCTARDGRRIIAEDIMNTADPRTDLVRSFGIQAYACHPLLSKGGKVIGTLSFGTRSRTSFSEDELALMKTVADEVAAAMERIRLTEAESRRVAELQSFLSSMSDGVILLGANGRLLLVNQAAQEILDMPEGEDFTSWVYRCAFYTMSGRPMARSETASSKALAGETIRDIRYRVVTPTGKEVVLELSASPVHDAGGRVVGSTTVFRDTSDRFELERQRDELYEREHRIADVLQQALVPQDPPKEIGGYRFAVRYKSALEEAEVGGDFYDIFALDDDRIGVLIGDVTGKGLAAAIRVAAARYSIRSYAYLDPRPGRVLSLANDALCRDAFDESAMLTAFFGIIDTRVGVMAYSNAGHEPPIVMDPAGDWQSIRLPGLPLGISGSIEYSEDSLRLNPGDRVVMVTDGITEARRPGPVLFGIHGLIDFLERNYASGTEEIAHGILLAAMDHANGRLQDDAAVIVFEQSTHKVGKR